MPLRNQVWLSVCLALAVGGCAGSSAPPPEAPQAEAASVTTFSPRAARGHLEALAAIGPREMGTEGSAKARAYIRQQLEALGLEVFEQVIPAQRAGGEEVTLYNIVAGIPGESEDLFLVLAPYDTRGFDSFENLGIHDGGSGVAVSLELARLVSRNPLPYSTWFVFLDGEQAARGATQAPHVGSRALVALLRQREAVEQVRLALVINRVCDPDLHIARDLGSHRVYRDEFFRSAARLGLDDAFDARAEFESPREGQTILRSGGLRRVVVLADTSFGGDEPPGPLADSADDDLAHCSDDSLEIVGRVAYDGLGSVARRLRRIDRFADAPAEAARALRLGDLLGVNSEDEEAGEAGEPDDAGQADEPDGSAPAPDAAGPAEPDPAAAPAQPPSEDPGSAAEAAGPS